MKPAVRNILFITWDGPQTNYLERLFLPILAGLQDRGYRAHVLQFCWGEPAQIQARADLCREAGVPYRAQTILRFGGAAGPFLTALGGARAIRRSVAEWRIDTLMPRSLLPAFAVLRMKAAERAALNIVFDADGLHADERVDFTGLSPTGPTYRILRDIEMQMLLRSDTVLTRTAASRSILLARAGGGLTADRCHLVTNGVDPAPFIGALAAPLPDPSPEAGPVLCYCGSIGAQYRLPDMLDVALRLRARIPGLRFRVISQATDAVQADLARRGLLRADWIDLRAPRPEDVPAELAGCDLGLALRLPAFSTRAVLPIKLGEYLLAGLPVLGTPGVGNTAELAEAGVFRSAEPQDLDQTITWLVDTVLPARAALRQTCHAIGLRDYAVAGSVASYATALASLVKPNPAPDPL